MQIVRSLDGVPVRHPDLDKAGGMGPARRLGLARRMLALLRVSGAWPVLRRTGMQTEGCRKN